MKKQSTCSRFCWITMAILGFLGLSGLILVYLGPSYLFRKPEDLRLGVLYNRHNVFEARLKAATDQAVDDIHRLVLSN